MNNSGNKKKRPQLKSLLMKNRGYFQIPNLIFDLDLSVIALVVFFYLVRCANRDKGRECFPNIKNICLNCDISSPTTIRKALQELQNKELLNIKTKGRKNIYTISELIYDAIDIANGKKCHKSEIEDIQPFNDGIKQTESETEKIEPCHDSISPLNDVNDTLNDSKYSQQVIPNKTNRTRLNNNNLKTQSFSESSNEDKVKKYWDKALENFQSLEPEDRMLFDSRAYNLLDFSCPNPKAGTEEMKILRVQYYIYENNL